MAYLTSTVYCLLSNHFLCWYEAILVSFRFLRFPRVNHRLDFKEMPANKETRIVVQIVSLAPKLNKEIFVTEA